MIQVTVHDNENLERALRRFKKKFEKAGIIKDIHKNAYYIKPSQNRRIAKAKAIRRIKRMERLEKYDNEF
ncbi:MAG: 30S ribosomal protein S21 [Candidatus Marinimicrobia bacterium]|jgi:small subunit ribosomal protein S21|nr:30S ribosomal protein S21 [Candidatus Neomarinimicrobiota bacterium]